MPSQKYKTTCLRAVDNKFHIIKLKKYIITMFKREIKGQLNKIHNQYSKYKIKKINNPLTQINKS